ncbi:MAG: histidinol-phosphatase [bacterium]|nr:MAG: histidinol-phosphatase [bacterium]
MKPKLVDIHSHILPYIDDGADDWDSSLIMLKNAEAEGIFAIVATPHILHHNDFKMEPKIISSYKELCQRSKKAGLKIKIYLGCEIYAQPDISLNNKIATLNSNKKYFLVEFPMNNIPQYVPDQFFNFIVDDQIPIVAHPERNIGFQKRPQLVYEYVQRGALMQINEGSLRGQYGEMAKLLAFKMIENNLAHFVASDGHMPNGRTVTLAEGFKIVDDKFGRVTSNLLFYFNPIKAIQGVPIKIRSPILIEGDLKPKLWQRLNLFKI